MKLTFFRNTKIWQKMLLLLQIMIIPTIIIFVMFLFMMNRLQENESRIFIENISSIRAAYNVEIALLSLKGLRSNYILDGDKKWLKQFDRSVLEFNRWYNEAFESAKTKTERDILSAMALDFDRFLKIHDRIIELADKNRKHEATRLLLHRSSVSYAAILEGCGKLIRKNEELIRESETAAKRYLGAGKVFGYLTIMSFLAFGIILALIITKSIIDPIREMEKSSEGLIKTSGKKNELERLRERFQFLVEAIQDNQRKLVESEKKAAVGEIAAGISHELNNPIGIIHGFAEMLLRSKSLDASGKEMVNDIYKEARRCKKLLGDLLDFARTPEPNYHDSNIKKLVKETVKMVSSQAKYRNIRFVIKAPVGTHKIYMDSVQIRQVLLNLLLNACDAVKPGGIVETALETVDGGVRITIKDNGEGIRPENIRKLFSPFFSTKTDGVGLGLSVSKDIIDKHKGSVKVKSEYGKWTVFEVILPGGHHAGN